MESHITNSIKEIFKLTALSHPIMAPETFWRASIKLKALTIQNQLSIGKITIQYSLKTRFRRISCEASEQEDQTMPNNKHNSSTVLLIDWTILTRAKQRKASKREPSWTRATKMSLTKILDPWPKLKNTLRYSQKRCSHSIWTQCHRSLTEYSSNKPWCTLTEAKTTTTAVRVWQNISKAPWTPKSFRTKTAAASLHSKLWWRAWTKMRIQASLRNTRGPRACPTWARRPTPSPTTSTLAEYWVQQERSSLKRITNLCEERRLLTGRYQGTPAGTMRPMRVEEAWVGTESIWVITPWTLLFLKMNQGLWMSETSQNRWTFSIGVKPAKAAKSMKDLALV